jgi:hypothetical protein
MKIWRHCVQGFVSGVTTLVVGDIWRGLQVTRSTINC